jgi:hypothetical protein
VLPGGRGTPGAQSTQVFREYSTRPTGQHGQTRVGGNPIQPGSDRSLSVIPSTTPPGSENRLLDHVLGIQHGAEHAVAVHVQLSAVCADKLVERCGVVKGYYVGDGQSPIPNAFTSARGS